MTRFPRKIALALLLGLVVAAAGCRTFPDMPTRPDISPSSENVTVFTLQARISASEYFQPQYPDPERVSRMRALTNYVPTNICLDEPTIHGVSESYIDHELGGLQSYIRTFFVECNPGTSGETLSETMRDRSESLKELYDGYVVIVRVEVETKRMLFSLTPPTGILHEFRNIDFASFGIQPDITASE